MAAADLQSGIYFIQNLGTGTVIDLKSGSSVEGTDVQGYVKRELADVWVPAQLWVINKGTDGYYTFQNTNSRTYLDLRSNSNGAAIEGFNPTNSDFQKWVITRAKNGTSYVICNKATKTYVDLYNGDPASGAKVQGWAGSGPTTINTHQLWLIVCA